MTVRNAESMGTHGSEWQTRGYSGKGNVRDLLGSLTGRPAIVCGTGRGVFEEYQAALAAYPDAVVFAANDVGMYLPKLDHWVSLHVDNLAAWKAVRWLHQRTMETTVYHSDTERPWLNRCWQQLTPLFCLSGYFAMQVAWVMGADRIVLCGCPGDGTPRYFEAVTRQGQVPDSFRYGAGQDSSDTNVRDQLQREMERLPDFRNAVRSMSGWTKEYFGGLD